MKNLFYRILIIHPSIFYSCLIRRSGRGGAGACPSGHRARGGVHPGQVASPSQQYVIMYKYIFILLKHIPHQPANNLQVIISKLSLSKLDFFP